jgi:hexosaminidase
MEILKTMKQGSRQIAAAAALATASPALSDAQTTQTVSTLQVIPRPATMEQQPGILQLPAREAKTALQTLLDQLLTAEPADEERAKHYSSGRFSLNQVEDSGTTAAGSYSLVVTPESIRVTAGHHSGLFYGLQTLRQLVGDDTVTSQSDNGAVRIPCVSITDAPRFSWRGLMLDCSRTFQSIEYMKKTIDRMAFYKMNVLHLHLTDDQGWRVEIKRYPELTGKGARFADKFNEPASHQGYYTQAEMRELIDYASRRHVVIVPEIEMPGHTLAALACYPELSCTGGPFEVSPFSKIEVDVLCAGNDKVFEFLENVLSEVVEVFPSDFIHIGGDEVPKERWKACPKCQARIREEKLADEHQLQSWFIKRIERFLNGKKRRLIGWDEILEGGLAPNAAVMSWRGVKGGITAAAAGHHVVMSPTSHCYFDYTYEQISTEKAHSFEPEEGLDGKQAGFLLGIQANFWSHIDREPHKVDRQIFPRLLGISERAWSPKDARDWKDFSSRMKVHQDRMKTMAIQAYDEVFK